MFRKINYYQNSKKDISSFRSDSWIDPELENVLLLVTHNNQQTKQQKS
jgi:hypothetical protein